MSQPPRDPVRDPRQLGVEAMGKLRERSVCDIEEGLSDDEIARIEGTFNFRFADDHRAFLAAGLPVNTRPERREPGVIYTHPDPWPDWRHHGGDELRARVAWPVEGVLFDVENNQFWYQAWGSRPDQLDEALELARRALEQVPIMVPVYGHRFLPAGAGTGGHPVLSMWQTDIIYYGLDISDYVDHEFGGDDRSRGPSWDPQATIEFWRDLV